MSKANLKIVLIIAGVVTGFIAGLAYWHFIGCRTGTCPLTSKWYSSAFTGALAGYLLSDSLTGWLNKD